MEGNRRAHLTRRTELSNLDRPSQKCILTHAPGSEQTAQSGRGGRGTREKWPPPNKWRQNKSLRKKNVKIIRSGDGSVHGQTFGLGFDQIYGKYISTGYHRKFKTFFSENTTEPYGLLGVYHNLSDVSKKKRGGGGVKETAR